MTKRRLSRDTQNMAESLLQQGLSPSEVHGILDRSPGVNDAPSQRTLERMLRDLRDRDGSEVWNWKEADPIAAALILESVGWINQFSEGRVQRISQRTADAVAAIRLGYPDIPPDTAYLLAASMERVDVTSPRADGVSGYLMYTPWRSIEHQQKYVEALDNKWIDESPPLTIVYRDDGAVGIMHWKTDRLLLIENPDE